jgi:RNA polymerase sigma factor (sigma-70 family)
MAPPLKSADGPSPLGAPSGAAIHSCYSAGPTQAREQLLAERKIVAAEPGNQMRAEAVVEENEHQAPRDEERLVEAARTGDLGAFEALMRRYERVAYRSAYFLTRDGSDAEEAVQDGFLKAYKALHRFRRGAPFKPWLLKIVTNEAKNRRRAQGRHLAIAARARAGADVDAVSASPELGVFDDEQRATLLAAVERLSQPHRDVVVCRYFLELSEEETADVLSIRRGTVKSRLSRALARLELDLGAQTAG